jgi:membrane fusion protein (multidrug efflux system)
LARRQRRRSLAAASGFAAALAALALTACGGGAPQAPPPPEVNVLVAQPRSIENVIEAPGRVQAVRRAEVRARVDGIVQRRLYEEGSDVQAGQKLFLIDPRELRANLSAVEAALVRAEATAANAAQDVERYKGLVEDQAISKQEYDAALARLRTAQADVAQTRAQLESARLSLSYTVVTAPIAGRAGRAQVTEGALVSAAEATLLTTIEQLDPIYINFSQSSSELMSLRREVATGVLQTPELTRVPVTLQLEDGSPYPHPGHLDFLDLSIDEATGTVAARAEFPNPNRVLLPGQFVRARIEAGVRPNAFMIPQRAVLLTASSASVLIVDQQNVAAAREVELGPLQGGQWLVLGGLRAGDRVIVDGLQKVQPGATVRIARAAEKSEGAPAAQADDSDAADARGQGADDAQQAP